MATFSLMPTGYSQAHLKTISLRQEILKEAREWIGTPWQHHQCCKGVGADCVGFVWKVGKNCGLDIEEAENYYRTPKGDALYEELAKRFYPIPFSDAQSGDVLLFKIKCLYRHVGFLSENGNFIHCSNRHGVVEVRLDARWKKLLAE